MTFFTYLMLVLWYIGIVVMFIIEMTIMLPFVLIEETYKRIKNYFLKRRN